ncbi:MAG TPA: hypothetical protein VHU84_02280 [Lacipirellulaceae bacterium]|jgi:hypothetical protein|nr:hypothetical protein [Lacipirellulaceae bacterium]
MNQLVDGIAAGESRRASLANQVGSLLARLHPSVETERRKDERVAIPVLFRLTPLDVGCQPSDHEATIVVGKNISRCGLCFFHERPISERRALIELAQPGLGSFAAEIDITWCRFTRPGWYESGGRLVRSVITNGEQPSDQPFTVEMSRLASFLVRFPANWAT